ncbi:MAG: hypothetical protein WC389_13950 [Lutibacter sp.]|jgi:Zn ribbon nucleic-acid-binding protein
MSASIAQTKWIRGIPCPKCGAYNQLYEDKDEFGRILACLTCGFQKNLPQNPTTTLPKVNFNELK